MMYKFRTSRPNALILVLLYFVLIFVATFSITLPAKAAPANDATLDEQARSYIYLKAFSVCMNSNTLASLSITNPSNQWIGPDQAIDGKFFAPPSNNPLESGKIVALDVSLGYINTSKQGCHETGWIQDSLRLWGWNDNIEALQAFGFTANGEGDFIPPPDKAQKFNDAVFSKYYGGSIPNFDAMQYQLYSEAFDTICGATKVGPKAGASPSDLALLNTKNGYLLKTLNDKYEVEETIFKASLEKSEKIDVIQGEYISCIDTVNKANQFIDAYKTYMQQNKEKEPAPGETPIGTGENTRGNGCDDALSPFGWVLCPILSLANNAYTFLADWIQDILFFDSKEYSDSKLQEASAIFVRIANILIVLFALLAIAAQVFNFEFLNTYTIKKILPKLFIGAILIQFSWPLFTTLIQIVNAIGSGLYYLLLLPFDLSQSGSYVTLTEALQNTTNSGAVGNVVGSAGTLLGVGLAGFAIAQTGAWLSIIVLALGVITSVLIAILTLIVRQVILIVLLAIAPLALAFWIFPGTNKYWDLWWKSFSKLLLMYPLIMLLLAGGTMAAYILSSASSDGGLDLNKIAAIVAYFAPIFLIGWTFKFAGQAFSSVAALSNKWGSKAAGSGMFGLRTRARENRENSAWNRGVKLREAQRRRNATELSANYLSPDNPSGLSTSQRLNRRVARMGLNNESRLASQASAVNELEKIQHEEKQSEMALLRERVQHMKRDVAAAHLIAAANAQPGSARSSAAIELMTTRRMNSELSQVSTGALNQTAQSNAGVESYIWQNRRDLSENFGAVAGQMTAPDLQGQAGAFWTAAKNDKSVRDSLSMGALQALYDSEAFGGLSDDAKSVINTKFNEAGLTYDSRGGAVVTRELAAQGGSTGSSSTAAPRNPTIRTATEQASAYSSSDLAQFDHSTINMFVQNAGGMTGLHDADLDKLHGATQGKTDAESIALHSELQNEINRRRPPAGTP